MSNHRNMQKAQQIPAGLEARDAGIGVRLPQGTRVRAHAVLLAHTFYS